MTKVWQICNAYESGFGHGFERDGLDLSKTQHSDSELGEAYQIGYEAGEEAREELKNNHENINSWKYPQKGELPETGKDIYFIVYQPSGKHRKHIGTFEETDTEVFKFKCSFTGRVFHYYQVTAWLYLSVLED